MLLCSLRQIPKAQYLNTALTIQRNNNKNKENKVKPPQIPNKMRKLTSFVCGTGAGLAAYYLQRLRDPQTAVQNSWTHSDKPVDPWALWDSNWDCREPRALVRPLRNSQPEEENRFNAELEKAKAKKPRHIILVRHGEYLDVGDSDDTHHLTERGRKQAEFTGKRLCELGIKWDKVVASTMVRAQETSDIILKQIDYDKEKVVNCAFLREGAPIPPQPPVGHWKPEASVSQGVNPMRTPFHFRISFPCSSSCATDRA